MVDPIWIVKDLVVKIMKNVSQAKANKEECWLLGEMVKRTEEMLDLLAEKKPFDPPTKAAIDYVVEALKEVNEAIEACCKSRSLISLFGSGQHAFQLKLAFSKLQFALNRGHLALFNTLANIQEFLNEMSKQFRQAQKDTQETIKQEMEEVKKVILKKFSQQDQETKKVRELLVERFQQVSQDIEELKKVSKEQSKEITQLRKEITQLGKENKESSERLSKENKELRRLVLTALEKEKPGNQGSRRTLEWLNNEMSETEDNNNADTNCFR